MTEVPEPNTEDKSSAAQEGKAVASRRTLLVGLGVGVVALSGYALLSNREVPEAAPPEVVGPKPLESWVDAFGYTLIPLLNAEHLRLWRRDWAALPTEKDVWLDDFKRRLDGVPLHEDSLVPYENAISDMLAEQPEGDNPLVLFLNTMYQRLFSHPTFVELSYVDGPYIVGEADPRYMAEWGVVVSSLPDA